MPRIYGQNIMLREYMKEDLPHMYEWVNDPDIVSNLSDIFLFPNTLNGVENYLNYILEGKASNEAHFVIAVKSTGKYLGQIDLKEIDWKNSVADLGIVIGKKENLGKGIGTEALKLLQNFVFERLNLNRLELAVHEDNERAKACYLKCGFIEEGRCRQKRYKNGKYIDMVLMSILRDEYYKISEQKEVI